MTFIHGLPVLAVGATIMIFLFTVWDIWLFKLWVVRYRILGGLGIAQGRGIWMIVYWGSILGSPLFMETAM